MGSSPTRGDTNGIWSYSVMVITLDSESSDPGSSPGRTFFNFVIAMLKLTQAHNEW